MRYLIVLLSVLSAGCGNAVSGAGAANVNASVEAQLTATIKELELLNTKLICYLAVERACKDSTDADCVTKGNANCDKVNK